MRKTLAEALNAAVIAGNDAFLRGDSEVCPYPTTDIRWGHWIDGFREAKDGRPIEPEAKPA